MDMANRYNSFKFSKYNSFVEYDDNLYIYNSFTGGLLEVDKTLKDYFKAKKSDNQLSSSIKALSDETSDNLLSGGILVDSSIDETEALICSSQIHRFATDNLTLTIAPTTYCNFRCPYCFENIRNQTSMSEETIAQIPRFIKSNFPDLKALQIVWYGGEPLLELDKISLLTSKLINNDYYLQPASIVTNGYLLNKQIAHKLVDLGINNAQVTIDGSRNDHNLRRIPANGSPTFDRILKNIQSCSNLLNITIRINADKTNVKHADELLEDLEKAGLKDVVSISLSPVTDYTEKNNDLGVCFSSSQFADEEYIFYKKAVQKGFDVVGSLLRQRQICGAISYNSYVIDPHGDLYKCWDSIGNIDEKVGTIYDSLQLNTNLCKWLTYNPYKENCISCKVLPMCNGGCPNQFIQTGSLGCCSSFYNLNKKLKLISYALNNNEGDSNE